VKRLTICTNALTQFTSIGRTDRENSHNSIVVGVTHILTLWFLPNLSHCIFSGVLTGILAVCLVAAWLLIKYSALSTQQLVIASAKWCVELERVA